MISWVSVLSLASDVVVEDIDSDSVLLSDVKVEETDSDSVVESGKVVAELDSDSVVFSAVVEAVLSEVLVQGFGYNTLSLLSKQQCFRFGLSFFLLKH